MEALVHEVVKHVHVRSVLHVHRLERDHALKPQVLALRNRKAFTGWETGNVDTTQKMVHI